MLDHDETLETLESKMGTWHRWWSINGDHLECVKCKACQWPWNASTAFIHIEECTNAAGAPLFPWRDLAKILRP